MAKGTYRVEFKYFETDGTERKEPMTVPLSPASKHDVVDGKDIYVGPWLFEGKPYEGELDDEEVEMLNMLPGKVYSPHWRFTVSKK